MNERQYQKYAQLMKLPVEQRKHMALNAQGEIQLILSYDPHEEVLDALVENPQLTIRTLVNIAKKRSVSSKMIEKIAENKSWLAYYDLKFELIKNPRTPLHVSLKLIKYLYRKELQFLARDVGISQSIRQYATGLLEAKLADLLPGEKMAMAREAVGPLLSMLLADKDEKVIAAALQNPRLRENDVIVMANRKDLKASIIRAVIMSRWIKRYTVKIALSNNPNTPPELIQDLIKDLFQQDLQELIKNPILPTQTRLIARHMLKMRIFNLPEDQLIRLARTGRKEIVNILIEKEDLTIIKSLETNSSVVEGQMVSLAVKTASQQIISYLALESSWRKSQRFVIALDENPHTPDHVREMLQGMLNHE